ncbi:hypothetical protein [Streptomyces sp. NPDC056296]|uniref:hypothetical protein n=1 Tax=Streptomyces sp. NPDC056296 TaxID=3345775 RepID=UPI0035E3A4CA
MASGDSSWMMRCQTRSGGVTGSRFDASTSRAAVTTRVISFSSSRQRRHDATCRRALMSSSLLA